MTRLNIRRLTNENEDGAPRVSGISTFSSTAFLVPPRGSTAQRPSDNVRGGMMRFNTDSGHLEYYDGSQWTDVLVANNSLDGGNRGLFGGGENPQHIIDYITISTLGNAINFGDLTVAREGGSACSSSTRGVFADGTVTPTGNVNVIDYVTISTQGNAVDFGDRTEAKNKIFGCSNAHGGL
jgi:hypothetical protein